MKFMNVRKIKKWGRRALALGCALGSMVPMMMYAAENDAGNPSSADILSTAVYGQIALIKWTGFNYTGKEIVIETSGIAIGGQEIFLPMPRIPGGEYYVAMLAQNGKAVTGEGYYGGSHVPLKTNDWIPKTYNSDSFTYGDTFYSAGTHGSSMFYLDQYYEEVEGKKTQDGQQVYKASSHTGCEYFDTDNWCYRLAWWVCDEEGNPIGPIGRNDDALTCTYYLPDKVKNNNGVVNATVHKATYDQYLAAFDANGTGGTVEATAPTWNGSGQATLPVNLNAYREDYLLNMCLGKQPLLEWLDGNARWWSLGQSDHATCLFHNTSGKDPRVKRSDDDSYLWCETDKDWWDACEFNMWKGDPTLYSCMTQNYTIANGQTLNLNAEEEKLAGVYIPKGVTLTVEKGGTLSINETVFCDGKIVNNGGTVIIQSKGRVCPFAADGTNGLTVKNNGVFIVMPEGGYFTPNVAVFAESRLVNFGVCAFGNNLQLYSSFVENREGGTLLMGYNYANKEGRPSFESADFSQADMGKIDGMSKSDTLGKIYAYDTKGHYSTYGCFDNNGAMPGFTEGNGVDGDVKLTQIGGDNDGGEKMRELLVSKGYRDASNASN